MQKNQRFLFLLFFCIFLCILLTISPLFSKKNKDKAGYNVLLITIDTLRADRLSCYSRKYLKTPNIDSLAEKGILFTKTFAHTSTTLPSHTNILLGTLPIYHGVHDNSTFIVKEKFLTLAEHLKNSGYSTGAFVGAYPLDSRFGLTQGFNIYDDEYGNQHSQKLTYVERNAGKVVDNALNWLKSQKEPWFLWIHCFDPHYPYEPPEPFKTQYSGDPYNGEVAYVDFVMGKLFGYMRENDFFDKTLIIFSGDHGESLGQHGEQTHGYFAYNSSIWVPMIVSIPGIKPGRVHQQVGHIDIFPTVCDVLAIEKPSFLQGVSLLPAIRGKKLPRRLIYFESMYPYYSRGWAPLKGYIYGRDKFIDTPIPELYDLEKDFDELKNLAETNKLEKYQKKLAQIVKNLSIPEEDEEKMSKIDRESVAKLRSLGYISSPQILKEKSFGLQDDIKILLPFHYKVTKAMDLYKKGNVNKGFELLKEVIMERKDIDIAYSNLATLYKEQGKLKEALEVLELGLEHLPSSYEVFLTYINYLINAGQYDKVIEALNTKSFRQMEYDPEIWNYLGVAYMSKGDFEKALEAYKMALSLDNEYSVVFNNLGTVYLFLFLKTKNSQSYRESIQNFKKAIELDPDYATAYNGLGGAYLQVGNLDGAIYCLEKAVELQPDFSNAIYNLGLAYLGKGYKERALDVFKRYKENYYRFLSLSEKNKLEVLIQKCKEKL
ncbi:MAG: sulfatase-like hydrolase/transferase [Candidatus Aminicenantaceae bacterium]